MHCPCSENKGADQLRGYREADLRLCFRLCRLLVFPRGGSDDVTIQNYSWTGRNKTNVGSPMREKWICHLGHSPKIKNSLTYLLTPI